MIGKIYYIANHQSEKHTAGTFGEFVAWIAKQRMYQLDVETDGDKTKFWNEINLKTIQFGSCTADRVQWFLQWSALTEVQKGIVKNLLQDDRKQKLIHNAAYEYIILRFHGIIIENVYDTMLAEKVLMGGLENENYALADISYKYLRIIMDKSLQMSFADDVITDDKITYGITDVAYLDVIRTIQLMDARLKGVMNVISLENDAVLAFSDITFNGMILDKEKWRENERLAWPVVHEALAHINTFIEKEPFKSHAIAKGYYSEQDRTVINFGSHQQKGELIKLIFPDIVGAGLPVIEKYLREHPCTLSPEQYDVLDYLQYKDTSKFEEYLIKYHKEYLVENEYLIPARKVTINWYSPVQVLELFQLVLPKMKGVGEDERNKFAHPLLKAFEKYKSANKLVTDLGENFITNYVGPDGKVRTNFNQIVSTGRCSCSNPNMQNITVAEEVGTRYRNAFIWEPGWSFVDSDYISQELVIIAYISKDPVWMEAIDNGWDLHSIVSKMMYGKKWDDAAEANCAFATHKQKCSCKKHKVMRYDCKTISFGLAYGMSEFKLAGELDITVPQALALLELYFKTFPLIGDTLQFLGEFGLRNGYIMTLAPFHRKRWFPYWREWTDYVEQHIQDIKYIPALGEIERASKNQPIQGASADITKCAMVLVREYIRDNNLWDSIKLVAQVHDQVTTVAIDSIKEEWKITFDQLMRDAAKVVIPTGILKADTQITGLCWTK